MSCLHDFCSANRLFWELGRTNYFENRTMSDQMGTGRSDLDMFGKLHCHWQMAILARCHRRRVRVRDRVRVRVKVGNLKTRDPLS